MEHDLQKLLKLLAQANHPGNDDNDTIKKVRDEAVSIWQVNFEAARASSEHLSELRPFQSNLLASYLWVALADHNRPKEEIQPIADNLLSWIAANPKEHHNFSGLAAGGAAIFAKRDKTLIKMLPIFLNWAERNLSKRQTRRALFRISDQIIAISSRSEDTGGLDTLRSILPYFKPDDEVYVNCGQTMGPWVWAWKNSNDSGKKVNESEGPETLRILCQWGADVDAPNKEGETILEASINKIREKGGRPFDVEVRRQRYHIDNVLTNGAKWKAVFETATEEERTLLKQHPAVRSTLLHEQAQLTIGQKKPTKTPSVRM